MRLLFIEKDPGLAHGIMCLSAYVRAKGHTCKVFFPLKKDWQQEAFAWKPDLVAFSGTSGKHLWVLETAARIKAVKDVPIIMGGPHATYFPGVVENSKLDFVCRGEGEEALVELLGRMEAGEDLTSVRNLWVKEKDGTIHRNEVRPYVEDLDGLPAPDRSDFLSHRFIVDFYRDHFDVMTGRGCPFNCTFCYARAQKRLYRGKGRHVRKRSVERVIDELTREKARYGIRRIVFEDDTFTIQRPWLMEFLVSYRRNVSLPFICNARADQVDEELLSAMKESGCTGVKIGIESQDEEIRNKVLRKGVSNEQIERATALIKAAGIDLQTFSILGIPGVPFEKDWENLEYQAKLGVTHAFSSVMTPYPGTEILEYAVAKGYVDGDAIRDGFFANTYFRPSNLDIPNKREVVNLQHLFNIGVHYPSILPLLRRLIRLPLTDLYMAFFKIYHMNVVRKFYHFRWLSFLRFLFVVRKHY